MKSVSLKVVSFILIVLLLVLSNSVGAFNDERNSFSLEYKGYTIPYKVFSIFVLPGEEVNLSVESPGSEVVYIFQSNSGQITKSGSRAWSWEAPDTPGHYQILINSPNTSNDESITLNVFVLVPKEKQKGEYLNGYRIGNYSKIPRNMLPRYSLPEGFIEVNKENKDIFVSPHFQLGQFLCKQKSNYPKYIVLKESLLLKLELLLIEVNDAGYKASTFHILSGYRTPYYNKALGNSAFSRHLWGDAADIFIDENGDGMMDDLNKDGKININDLRIIYRIIDTELYGRLKYIPLIGGMGMYERNEARGPFIHIDARGTRARW